MRPVAANDLIARLVDIKVATRRANAGRATGWRSQWESEQAG